MTVKLRKKLNFWLDVKLEVFKNNINEVTKSLKAKLH